MTPSSLQELGASLLSEVRVPAAALLWMALAPDRTWTLVLAEASGFPRNDSQSVQETLDRMCQSDFARFKEPFYTVEPGYLPLILQPYLKSPDQFAVLRETLIA